MSAMKRGRHPHARKTVVRLIDAAVGDLERMVRKGDPQVVRWALKKMLLLERDPEAGAPLLGGLIGWRKLVVGDRDWRVVWRVGHDAIGNVVVDIAEVWAVGARSDAEVYAEVQGRVDNAEATASTQALADVITGLGRLAGGLRAPDEPHQPDDTPDWLVAALTKVAGLSAAEVADLSPAEAHEAWLAYTTGHRQ